MPEGQGSAGRSGGILLISGFSTAFRRRVPPVDLNVLPLRSGSHQIGGVPFLSRARRPLRPAVSTNGEFVLVRTVATEEFRAARATSQKRRCKTPLRRGRLSATAVGSPAAEQRAARAGFQGEDAMFNISGKTWEAQPRFARTLGDDCWRSSVERKRRRPASTADAGRASVRRRSPTRSRAGPAITGATGRGRDDPQGDIRAAEAKVLETRRERARAGTSSWTLLY